MTFTPIDQETREQIRTDLATSMCVEAGAGTGKTTSLVSRIVELLATGTATADSIVVITFTEKAAAELSSRVRDELNKAADLEPDAERRERLVVARKALYRAHIETIHAFAAALLHERPVEAGLDPQFEVLSGLEQDLSFDAAYDEWLDKVLRDGDEDLGRALNLGLDLGMVRDLARAIDAHRFLLPLQPFDEPDVDVEAFAIRLGEIGAEMEKLCAQCTKKDDGAYRNAQNALALRDRIADPGISTASRERAALNAWYYPKGKTKAGSKERWQLDEALDRVRELCIEVHEELGAFKAALRSVALLRLIPRAEEFVAGYAEQRRLEGQPDFDDLLIWARNLLRDNPQVRGYFQDRFSHLLIDEFQDTDPIQVELAMYLTSGDRTTTAWRGLSPVPGKLFVVGDPKQSIYRFRRADIAIYDEVKRDVLAEGLRLIVQNFRSVEGVIEWVNQTFNHLLVEEQGVQPGNEALVPLDVNAPDERFGRPPVVIVHGGEDGMSAEALRRAEATAIASLLHEAVERDHWPIRDRTSGEWRDAKWGDIAILMPTRSGLDAYERALGLAGIPYRHSGSRDYFRRQEVRDLIHILRAIDDSGDPYSIVGALRSSAFGCSDADLVTHLAGDGKRRPSWNYWRDEESASPQVAAGFEVLRDLAKMRRGFSLGELVRRVIEESQLVEFALTLPDGPQAAANLLAIGEQAQSFSSVGGGGLRAFTRWLDQSVETESQEVDAGITEEADEVVRLMTIHGSKGLEFPIVVLGNLSAGGRNDSKPVVDEKEHRLHLRVGSEKRGRFETPGFEARLDEEKRIAAAEEIRLLYVGTTRARDHLIIPRFEGTSLRGNSPISTLDDVLPPAEGHQQEVAGTWMIDATRQEIIEVAEENRPKASAKDVKEALRDRAAWEDDGKARIKTARREMPFIVASSIERSATPMSAEGSSSSASLLLSEGPPIPIGDALHLVMERVTFPRAADLDAVAAAVCADGGIEDHLDEVLQLANRCLESATVRRAIASGSVQREIPFTMPTEDGGFVTGRMDLVFEDEGEYVIVDYKTDNIETDDAESHTLAHHAGQASAYSSVIERQGTLGGTVFVYPRAGTDVTITAQDIS